MQLKRDVSAASVLCCQGPLSKVFILLLGMGEHLILKQEEGGTCGCSEMHFPKSSSLQS